MTPTDPTTIRCSAGSCLETARVTLGISMKNVLRITAIVLVVLCASTAGRKAVSGEKTVESDVVILGTDDRHIFTT